MAQNREFDVSNMEEHSKFKCHNSWNAGGGFTNKDKQKNPDVKYFSGKITDGKKVARIISFDPKVRSILEKSREEKTSLALTNCNVRKGKFDSGIEVMANNYTKVPNSLKRFKVDDVGICWMQVVMH